MYYKIQNKKLLKTMKDICSKGHSNMLLFNWKQNRLYLEANKGDFSVALELHVAESTWVPSIRSWVRNDDGEQGMEPYVQGDNLQQ